MIETKALSPSLGVEVTGVGDPLDDELISRCTKALKWRGVLPIRGLHLGGTEFASTYAAYENLPEPDRKRFDDLRVVHSLEAAQRLVNPDPDEKLLASWRTVPTHETPLVWRRRDGRCSLVTGATADHIAGMERAESRALLDELPAWCTQERFRSAHDWRVGDFVMWDNTGMLHRALPYDPSSERTLHRTTAVGDEALV